MIKRAENWQKVDFGKLDGFSQFIFWGIKFLCYLDLIFVVVIIFNKNNFLDLKSAQIKYLLKFYKLLKVVFYLYYFSLPFTFLSAVFKKNFDFF